MRKIGDTYYCVFADTHRGKPTALGYAMSKSPLGPFTYRGIIVDNDGCDPESWNNHGSIECVNGRWYVFYHRSTGRSRYLRRMCAEPIAVDENGLIAEVPVTSTGMGEAYRAGETLPGYQACQVDNAWIDGDRLIIDKGKAKVVFRYVDLSEAFSAVTCDNKEIGITWRTDEKGELTLLLEANQKTEIRGFMLEK